MTVRGLVLISLGIAAIGSIASCSAQRETGSGGVGGFGGFGGTAATTTTTTTTGQGGHGGFGGSGIAASCSVDADCGHGLTCLLDTANDPIFGGGPPGGFCTRSCADSRDCLEPGATCLQIDPMQPGRCTISCNVGAPIDSVEALFEPLDASKCLGREDLRCGKVKDGVGVCLPTCGKDTQCAEGRACDPRLAVCVDVAKANTGSPLGAACDPTASEAPCAGTCVGFDNGAAMCSSPCVLGGEKLGSADCGGVEHGFCAFHLNAYGAGDVGHCTPSCAAQSDCQSPAFWCFDVVGLSESTQRGYCFAAAECPNGQDDCTAAGVAADVCTETKFGAFCLDPSYPAGTGGSGCVGGAGTGGAGAEDAGAGDAGPDDAGPGDAGSGGTGSGGSGGAGP